MAKLREKEYRIRLRHLPAAFAECRMVFLSDLHGVEYGEGNRELIARIRQLCPDYILVGGDMMVGFSDPALAGKAGLPAAQGLLERLSDCWPVYYAMGNHEGKCSPAAMDAYFDVLWKRGVHILDNESAALTRAGTSVRVYGLTLEQRWYPKLRRRRYPAADMAGKIGPPKGEALECRILLAHSPLYFKSYAAWGADLVLSGHLHGGVVRLPGIGGLLGPDFIPFPPYSGGLYRAGGSQMVVSCGLGSHTIPFRLFNPPELVCVTLLGENEGKGGSCNGNPGKAGGI